MADNEHVETSVVVERPIRVVYDQWTQFEDFPEFMKGVERVEQLTDTRVRWHADIGFVEREWEAEITEQTPDRVIAWKADGDVCNDGRVTFQELAPGRTEVTVHMEYAPQGFVETAGAKLGAVEKRCEGDLERFKAFIEDRRSPTGAHRDHH
jgi:uncharacterized membrane protein